MGSVYSLRGGGYVLPSYKDRGGHGVRFEATLKAGTRVPVSGFEAPLGLVLHRALGYSARGWTISEPSSGCRVAAGRTRQEALDALAQLVAYEGGEVPFRASLKSAVSVLLQATT